MASAPSAEPEAGEALDLRVPRPLLFGFLAAAALGLLTTNGLLTAASVLVLGLLVWMLWRPGEPPVMLFAVGFQWVQVTAKVFHADVFGWTIEEMSMSPSIREATWLSLVALVVLAAGIRLVLSRVPAQGVRLAAIADQYSVGRAFWIWVVGTGGAAVIQNIAWTFGSLTQILMATVNLKWAAFFWLAYLAVRKREGYALVAIAFGVELVQSVGFFSDFKTVFFVTVLAVLATRVRLTGGTVATGVSLVVLVLALGSAWTIIKPSFRGQSEDKLSQTISGSRSEQLQTLGRLLGRLSAQDLVIGLDPLFRRVAYTDQFAYTMDFVPRYRDYGRGEIWGSAVRHVITPRLLFPNKPVLLSDSEMTMQWTGQYLASDQEGTSISIGYVGESYADLGRVGMFGVVFVLGLLWGGMYLAFLRNSATPLISLGFALVVLLGAYQFEMASIKLLGGVLMQFLVLWLIHRLFAGRLRAWLGDDAVDAAYEPGVDYVALAGSR